MIVWLASYPRSGNTFLRILLSQVFGLKSTSMYRERVGWRLADILGDESLPEDCDFKKLSSDKKKWLIKTHEAPIDNSKAIYVVRDGRAALASYYFFHREILQVEASLPELITGEKGVGSWSWHLAQWVPLERRDTLFLRHEDLTNEPGKFCDALSSFLEQEPRKTHIPTFKELKERSPVIFRSGRNDSWRELFGESELDLFWHLHGETMRKYGYTE
jgi:hypothetical protein